MSEDFEKLEERLEHATAPGDAIDDSLDAETRSLREGWLALDELIEAAQPPDGAPPRLRYPVQAASVEKQKPAFWKTPAVLEVLAASLLVAAWAVWSLVDGQDDQKIAKDQNQDQLQIPIDNVQPVLVKDEQTPGNRVADEFDWDSPIDTEIAAAGQKMLSIKADWYASADTTAAVYYNMQQMQDDLGGDTL